MRRVATACYALLLCVTAWAGDVSLAWDHSISGDVTGYRLHYGATSGSYTVHVDVPYQTTWTLTGLAPGTYYIAATAYSATAESDYSNEVSTTVNGSVSCDVNGDGAVNVLDLQALANLILLGQMQPDLTGDGLLNVLDLQKLANVILGISTCE